MKERPGQAFERRVADAYRVLDYQVIRDAVIAGRQTDLIVRKEVPGAPTIKLAIECKDYSGSVGVGVVDEFAARVAAQCQAGVITGGAMVSSRGFTRQAKEAAERQKDLTLLSLEDLTSQIFDVRHPLRELTEHYERQAIFQDYLPLKVESLRWSTMMTQASPQDDFEPLLRQLIRFDGGRGIGALLVLADFGAGKTTLLRNIEYRRARAHLEGHDTRIPLFLQLRDFQDSQDVETLLRASFRDVYYRDLPLELLWQRIESGSFYLLLDGFDEMVDRSDANRRLELFNDLVPLLRSRSPVILTSRPSYMVERGELERLISKLRAEESSMPSAISGGSYNKVSAEHLRQQLFERMRESRRHQGSHQQLDPRRVEVVRLQALDREQVVEFVGRHADNLARVGASVAELIEFIDRTYDLTDLATRPMLLRMIVETAVIGGLDLGDTGTNYGPSGLYEIYTREKLDFDIEKVKGRDGGINPEARRLLAEALAMEMYRAKSLEVDFHETLERLAGEETLLGRTIATSLLSQGEIATDLAARSFATLDRNGFCRFIHKSFRGFFVARILKEHLPKIDSMFEEILEHEVLYFIGGFDPTEPEVGKALWTGYRQAPMEKVALRRNLLVAFLHTRPKHEDLRITDAEISEAEYGRLQLHRVQMKDVGWHDVTITKLDLVKVEWERVRLQEVTFTKLLTEGGKVGLLLRDVILESWSCEGTKCTLTAESATSVESWDVERAEIDCSGEELLISHLRLQSSEMACGTSVEGEFSITKALVNDSRLRMSGEIELLELEASNSLIAYDSYRQTLGHWKLKECVLYLSEGSTAQSALRTDRGSIILAPAGISHFLLTVRAGIFGSIAAAEGARPIRFYPDAWGVLEAEDILDRIGLPKAQPGCRLGRLLLVRKEWYEEEVAMPKRRRAVVAELAALVTDSELDVTDSATVATIAGLRRAAKSQYASLWKREWLEFEKFVNADTEPLPG